jgi:serine/threonine-protein kinase
MRFSRFELVARLGSGGMGEVWRARDTDLQREVAVKFLPERFASDATRLGRFAQEARAASSLNHPNIVTIHEIGQTSGLPYIVMELVDGRTLRELLLSQDGRQLPVRRLLEIGAQAAEGLAKAHAAGIVHRDLKPENVMVTSDGFVKVLDFGLAKLRSDGRGSGAGAGEVWFDSAVPTWPESPSPHTAVGAVIGTAGYMSPEQARGQAVDFRTDQFTLGAILYELASGRQAFNRETPAQTIAAIIEDLPEPLAVLNPGLPPPVRWLIERCLAKDPAERYASTFDLARELRGLRERLGEVGASSSTAAAIRVAARAWRPKGIALLVVAMVTMSLAAPSVRERLAVGLELRPVPNEKGVAVLPFRITSPHPEDRVRADGLGETLVSRLAQLQRGHPALWVVPSSEVRQAAVESAEAARRAFGVTLVMTGSVERRGELLRLNASLVDAVQRKQLRAVGPTDFRMDDLELQDRMLDSVVRMLELTLAPEEQEALRAGGTQSGGAHALYLEARGYLQRYDHAASVEEAVSLFQQALQQDPSYALAYAGLGEAQWRLYRLKREPERAALARKASERAIAQNDLLAPVHLTLGLIKAGTGEAQAALADFDRALALDPANVDALREKAAACQALGRVEEAEGLYRRAVERQPRYWGNHSHLGAFYYRHGRYAEAEAAFRKVVELVPDNPRGYSSLGLVLHTAGGRDSEAIAALQRSLALGPTYAAAANLGLVEFSHARYAQAARAYEKATELGGADYRVWRNLGISYYWTPGEQAKAPDALRRALAQGGKELSVNPKNAPLLADLGDCHALLGDAVRAREHLKRALALAPDDVEVLRTAAGAYEQVGDREAALRAITRALAAGYPRAGVEDDPGLAALRADPRYKRIGTSSGEGGPDARPAQRAAGRPSLR